MNCLVMKYRTSSLRWKEKMCKTQEKKTLRKMVNSFWQVIATLAQDNTVIAAYIVYLKGDWNKILCQAL